MKDDVPYFIVLHSAVPTYQLDLLVKYPINLFLFSHPVHPPNALIG